MAIKRPSFVFILVFILTCTAACQQTRPIDYRFDSTFAVSDPQFARTVGNLLGPPLIPGNRTTTLLNGDQIFPAMLDAIRSAKTSVTFETYVYWSGEVAKQFADALAERAAAGVKVHVLLDWIGAAEIDNKDWDRMKDAGVVIHKFHVFHIYDPFTWHQLDQRTHRKLLVVDGKLGFTGGVGIADMWQGNAQDKKHWRDTHYKVEGPVVAQLQAAFADNWMKTTGVVLEGEEYFPQLAPAGDQWAQVFKSSPTGGADTMQLLMLFSIAHAKKNIRIESAYFVPDDLTRDMLVKAANRGVKVDIIVPGRHMDEKGVQLASRASWGKMLRAKNLAIYEYQPTMMHCKLLIVDDAWTSIGSSNIDNRSFRINDEANLNILDVQFAGEQTRMFEEDKSRSKQITYEMWKDRPLAEKLFSPFHNLYKHEL